MLEVFAWIWWICTIISLVSRLVQLLLLQHRWVSFEEAIERNGEVGLLYIIALPIQMVANTVRFGLSYRWNKKVKYKVRIMKLDKEVSIHKGYISVFLYEHWCYKKIANRAHDFINNQDAKELAINWFNTNPYKITTDIMTINLYFFSSKLSKATIDHINNPKRDDVFGIFTSLKR